MYRTAFPNPMWAWRERVGDCDPCPHICGQVNLVRSGAETEAVAFVEPPSEFIHLIGSVFPNAEVGRFELTEGNRGRWYFTALLTGAAGGELGLWYWTRSTLPAWAKRAIV